MQFDPMTGAPVTQKPKSKVPVIVGAVAGVIVLVFLLVFGGIKSGLFLGKSGKVLLAANNTLKKMPHFVETLEPMLGLVEDEFTVEFSAKADGVKIGGSFINASKQKQVTAKLEYGGESIEGLAGVDSDSLKFQVPDLSKKLFVYNYKKENTGYIVDLIGDEYIDTLNSSLEQLVSGSKDTEQGTEGRDQCCNEGIKEPEIPVCCQGRIHCKRQRCYVQRLRDNNYRCQHMEYH